MTDAKKTRLVVAMNGGLIHAIYTNNPNIDIEVLVLDQDIDGAKEDQLIDLGGQSYYASVDTPMLNRDYVYGVFAAQSKDGFEFGINIHPPLPNGTQNPFATNFRTVDDAEAAGKTYLGQHPEAESFTVFVLELANGKIVEDESLYTVDREGIL